MVNAKDDLAPGMLLYIKEDTGGRMAETDTSMFSFGLLGFAPVERRGKTVGRDAPRAPYPPVDDGIVDSFGCDSALFGTADGLLAPEGAGCLLCSSFFDVSQ
ncbi:MAG: hypothetical protein ACOX0U_01115 [Oscillospiraceae bacterium]|jgi:hypothetical protein